MIRVFDVLLNSIIIITTIIIAYYLIGMFNNTLGNVDYKSVSYTSDVVALTYLTDVKDIPNSYQNIYFEKYFYENDYKVRSSVNNTLSPYPLVYTDQILGTVVYFNTTYLASPDYMVDANDVMSSMSKSGYEYLPNSKVATIQDGLIVVYKLGKYEYTDYSEYILKVGAGGILLGTGVGELSFGTSLVSIGRTAIFLYSTKNVADGVVGVVSGIYDYLSSFYNEHFGVPPFIEPYYLPYMNNSISFIKLEYLSRGNLPSYIRNYGQNIGWSNIDMMSLGYPYFYIYDQNIVDALVDLYYPYIYSIGQKSNVLVQSNNVMDYVVDNYVNLVGEPMTPFKEFSFSSRNIRNFDRNGDIMDLSYVRIISIYQNYYGGSLLKSENIPSLLGWVNSIKLGHIPNSMQGIMISPIKPYVYVTNNINFYKNNNMDSLRNNIEDAIVIDNPLYPIKVSDKINYQRYKDISDEYGMIYNLIYNFYLRYNDYGLNKFLGLMYTFYPYYNDDHVLSPIERDYSNPTLRNALNTILTPDLKLPYVVHTTIYRTDDETNSDYTIGGFVYYPIVDPQSNIDVINNFVYTSNTWEETLTYYMALPSYITAKYVYTPIDDVIVVPKNSMVFKESDGTYRKLFYINNELIINEPIFISNETLFRLIQIPIDMEFVPHRLLEYEIGNGIKLIVSSNANDVELSTPNTPIFPNAYSVDRFTITPVQTDVRVNMNSSESISARGVLTKFVDNVTVHNPNDEDIISRALKSLTSSVSRKTSRITDTIVSALKLTNDLVGSQIFPPGYFKSSISSSYTNIVLYTYSNGYYNDGHSIYYGVIMPAKKSLIYYDNNNVYVDIGNIEFTVIEFHNDR